MSILEELYHGNIVPNQRLIHKDSRTDELTKLIIRRDEQLLKSMSPEQTELFEKFKACHSELTEISECEIFIEAFVLGTRMIMEVIGYK